MIEGTRVNTIDRTHDVLSEDHLIAGFSGKTNGPTLIIVGGLHGNEPGGGAALSNVAERLRETNPSLNGRVYFLAGNVRALRKGVRFIDADLNRSWTARNLSSAAVLDFLSTSEGYELSELNDLIDSILVTARDEVYVLDLHSTSADGVPFATVGDTMRNRRFAQRFPISIILGIEEQLEGTMLEYLNNAGAVTLGFEGGQHDSPATVANHEALVWAALHHTGILPLGKDLEEHHSHLSRSQKPGKIFEIRHRHAVEEEDNFRMKPGFDNFDHIVRGQVLATDDRGEIKAVETGLLLMPLYQRLGTDGFFIGRRISPFWLVLSAILRRLGIQTLVGFLPGVNRDPDDPETVVVNTRVARFVPLQIFHLLGFRRRRWSGNKLIVSRRKHDTLSPFMSKANR